ncbi:MAG: hypothetical protein HY341_00180 [Candidatus Kerfeldbacteria bacterium]|nr:hypothetical protein [Candidatus Kerfeldbacteria bacterium]
MATRHTSTSVRASLRALDEAFAAFQKHIAELRAEQRRTVQEILGRVEREKIEKVRRQLHSS